MGKVLPFRPRDATPQVQQDSIEDIDIPDAYYNLTPEEGQKVIEAAELATEIMRYINSLEGSISGISIDLRRQGLRGMQLENLLDLLLASNRNEWKMRPAYFVALIKVISEKTGRLHIEAQQRFLENESPTE